MDKPSTWFQYRDRLDRVVRHIYDHLDDDLDFAQLAGIACLSPWHWHRIYRGIYGETVTATVKRLRLHRAAGDLANSRLPIAEVAKRAGYPNVQSFTRIFKAAYGMAPGRYRDHGSHTKFEQTIEPGVDTMYEVAFRTRDPMRLAGIAHKGSYMEIGKAFELLFTTLFTRGLHQPDMTMIGIYHDDPDIVAEDDLRSMACVTVGADFVAEPPLELTALDGGNYAVLTHKGPYADMVKAYRWFFGEWLTHSGKTLRNEPSFELYLNTPRDVPPTELLTEIWMPIE